MRTSCCKMLMTCSRPFFFFPSDHHPHASPHPLQLGSPVPGMLVCLLPMCAPLVLLPDISRHATHPDTTIVAGHLTNSSPHFPKACLHHSPRFFQPLPTGQGPAYYSWGVQRYKQMRQRHEASLASEQIMPAGPTGGVGATAFDEQGGETQFLMQVQTKGGTGEAGRDGRSRRACIVAIQLASLAAYVCLSMRRRVKCHGALQEALALGIGSGIGNSSRRGARRHRLHPST